MKKFKNIEEVWAAIDNGNVVYWHNESYKLTVEEANLKHRIELGWGPTFSQRGDEALRVTCISNWFGSFLCEKDLADLFLAEPCRRCGQKRDDNKTTCAKCRKEMQ